MKSENETVILHISFITVINKYFTLKVYQFDGRLWIQKGLFHVTSISEKNVTD